MNIQAQMVKATSKPSVGEEIQALEVASEEMTGTQVQAPEVTSEELVSAQPLMLFVQPVSMVSPASHSASSSHPPSIGVRDIEGLASLALTNLVATFQTNFMGCAHSVAIAPPLQLPVAEGQ